MSLAAKDAFSCHAYVKVVCIKANSEGILFATAYIAVAFNPRKNVITSLSDRRSIQSESTCGTSGHEYFKICFNKSFESNFISIFDIIFPFIININNPVIVAKVNDNNNPTIP